MRLSQLGIKTPQIWQVLLGQQKRINPPHYLPFLFAFVAGISRTLGYEIKFVLEVIMLLAKEACVFVSPNPLFLGNHIGQIKPHAVFYCAFPTSKIFSALNF